MRILVLHGNYFGDLWRREGHSVVVCSDSPDADLVPDGYFLQIEEVLQALGPSGQPDVVFFGDTSSRVRILGVERLAIPKVMWSIDTHHHADWQVAYAAAFDRVYVAQRPYLEAFRAAGRDAHWMPCFAPVPSCGTPLGFATEKVHDLCFVGSTDPLHHPARVRLIRALQERLSLVVKQGPYADTFATSRIVLNQTVKDDLNFRVFEALGCGSLLLTERSRNGVFDLFAEGRHLIAYDRGDAVSAELIARRYLADAEARRRVAEAGFDEVCRQHLRTHRAATLLAAFAELSAAPRPRRTQATSAPLELDLARTYLRIGASLIQNASALRRLGRLSARVDAVLHLIAQHVALARQHVLRAEALEPGTAAARELHDEIERALVELADLRSAWSEGAEALG